MAGVLFEIITSEITFGLFLGLLICIIAANVIAANTAGCDLLGPEQPVDAECARTGQSDVHVEGGTHQ